MLKGRTKLVVLLAVLIPAGGLIPALTRVWATAGIQQQDVEQKTEDRGQKTEDSFPSSVIGHPSSGVTGREFYYKMLLSVLLVIALGAGAVYVSKKWLPRLANQQGKQIRVLETAYLAPHKGIHLIQAGTRQLLIASTDETITMLADVTESDPGDASINTNGPFDKNTTDFAAQLKMRS